MDPGLSNLLSNVQMNSSPVPPDERKVNLKEQRHDEMSDHRDAKPDASTGLI